MNKNIFFGFLVKTRGNVWHELLVVFGTTFCIKPCWAVSFCSGEDLQRDANLLLCDVSALKSNRIMVVTSDCDCLRDEGRELAKKLTEAEAEVTALEGHGSHCMAHLLDKDFERKMYDTFIKLMLPQTTWFAEEGMLGCFAWSATFAVVGHIDWSWEEKTCAKWRRSPEKADLTPYNSWLLSAMARGMQGHQHFGEHIEISWNIIKDPLGF